MFNAIETAYFASTEPNRRYTATVHSDEDAADPRTEDYFLCSLTVATSGYGTDDNEGDYSDFKLSEAIERMDGQRADYSEGRGLSTVWTGRMSSHLENLVDAVNRYAALAGFSERIYLFEHTGHVQRDWASIIVEATSEEEARHYYELWAEWANGYVYGVLWETQKYDDEYDVWYTIDTDSIWGIRGFSHDYRAAMEYALKTYAHETLVLTEIEGD